MDVANRSLEEIYRHRYNEEFQQVAQREGAAFEPCSNLEQLDDILCEQYWRLARYKIGY